MTTLSNAELAERLTTTVDGWQTFVEQQLAWLTNQTPTVEITHPYTNEVITAQTLWKVVTDYEDILGENPARVQQIEQYIADFAGYELTLIGLLSQTETARDAAITAELEAESARDTAVSYRDQAATSETNAAASATAAATSETNAAASAVAASIHKDEAAASAVAADLSSTSASASATAAATSASEASASATAAAASELLASDSETAAQTSATAAATSESNAASSATSAATSETNAATSATSAASSATDANASAVAASTSASSAASSATAAELAATNAAASESTADASKVAAETAATNAASSETQAAASATAADQSAVAALASEQAAALSETAAAQSVTSAQAAQAAAETAEVNAGTSASAALASQNAASASEAAALASQTAAASSATAAATSETNAATSETNSATSAANAAQAVLDAQAAQSGAEAAEVNAAASASAASLSETAAQTAETNAQTAEANAASSATAADASASQAASSASVADIARVAAETAETNAAAAADAASSSEANAAASESKAADWAETPYGTEVEPGMYSALHWAAQAQINSSGITSTDQLAEGSLNLYWKEAPSDTKQYARQDGQWTEVVIPPGYGTSDFDVDFASKSTDTLQEGAGNLYFTVARAVAAIQGDISWNASNWDTAFSWGDHAAAGYLTSFTETDPTVPAHVKAIASTDVSNWNLAYSWGNHAAAGYLTSYTETDPTVPAHVKGITTANISNWNTAYSWGNHASAGYLTSLPSHTHDDRYFTESESDGRYVRKNVNYEWTSGQLSFRSADAGESTSGDQATLEVFQDTAGADAFMQFHVGGDYAAYFGLAGDWNDFFVGGWSMGGVRHRVWHSGNDGSGSGLDADTVDGLHSSSLVQTGNNTSLNSDSRNTRGVTRLYRRDGNSDYSVQTYWTGARWRLYGYVGDSNHADTHVGYADAAGSASSASSVPWSGVSGNPITTSTSNYGSIRVDDNRGVTWAGYAIRDDWVFMSDGAGSCGIYNDTDNEWAIQCFQNNTVSLLFNGAAKLNTLNNGVYVIGTVTASDSVATSDRNLKDNIESLSPDYCLEVVSGLRPVSYNWKEDGREDNGLIAQEVAEVAPLMTNEEVTAVNYQKIVTYLIGAVQKQQEQIADLQSQIDTLKKEVQTS